VLQRCNLAVCLRWYQQQQEPIGGLLASDRPADQSQSAQLLQQPNIGAMRMLRPQVCCGSAT
jgi:hypothetical protein